METSVHPLRYLFLEITQRCNLNCLHCGSDCGKKQRAGELTVDDWLDFIDTLAEDTEDPKRILLVITGGEPLCHPQLFELLTRVNTHGFPFGMVTNGLLLNRANLQRLVAHNITSLTVSLDGEEASHDWLRGVKGSFKRAVDGLAMATELPIRFLDVVTCVNPRNIEELPKVLALLRHIGVTRWRLFNIFPKGRAAHNQELILEEGQIRVLLDWISKTRTELQDTGFYLNFSCEGYLPAKVDQQVRDEPYFCRAGICIGSVLCDGAISACPNISRDLIQGNIRSGRFMQVWEEKFAPFRKRDWMRQGPCKDCNQWKRCKGNSLHLWNHKTQETLLCYHAIFSRRSKATRYSV